MSCLHGEIPLQVDEVTNAYTVPDLNDWEFKNRQIIIDDMDSITQQILWNDPILDYNPQTNQKFYINRRGIGYTFGKEVL